MVGVGGCVCALRPDHEIGTIVKNEWLWEVNAERSWHKSGAISFRSRQTRDLMIVLIIKEKATLSVFLHFSSRELMTCPDSFKNALWYEGRNKLRAPGVWWPGDDTEKEKGKMIQRCISPICLGRDESGPWAGGTRKGENGEDRGSLEAVTWECHPGSEKTSGFWAGGRQVCVTGMVEPAAWVASLANRISTMLADDYILEAKTTEINQQWDCQDASAPNSLCVKTCQLCQKNPSQSYSWYTVSRFRVEGYITHWSMIQREPKTWQQGLSVKPDTSCVTVSGWFEIVPWLGLEAY